MRHHLVLLILVPGISLLPLNARAQWQEDGKSLSTAANSQDNAKIVSDAAGGAIVTWEDFRGGGNYDVYVQRVNASGVPQWTPNGVALCTAALNQYAPTIATDGAGGAIVAWVDDRSGVGHIYAQRVNAAGVPQWTPDGVAVCTAAFLQYSPTIVSDGAGGAIVTWSDFRVFDYDIYAQRVNAAGTPLWPADGVALCTAFNDQTDADIVSDGAGGAIVTWWDYRTGVDADIYARRVNASGVPQWTADGVALCTAANNQFYPKIVSDGAGTIVAWEDLRGGAADIYAQRLTTAGALQWTSNGVALCTAGNYQEHPTIVSDGAGGAIVTWEDFRSFAANDIYAQRVSASGDPQWMANGVPVSVVAYNQYSPTIVSDGAGGAMITWLDDRVDAVTSDIYAQRLNASGVSIWAVNGVALCTAFDSQYASTIVADGAGGAIVTWTDYRSGSGDIYAQRVEDRYGYWGHPEPDVLSVADIPGDQGGKVKINWTASDWDILNLQTVTHYSIWRAADVEPAGAIEVASADDIDRDFSGAAYLRMPNDEYYWEWIGNQNALYSPRYSFSAATRSDSTGQGVADHYFQVVSHTWNQFTFWPSNAMNGHSVDNLAPAAPLLLTAQRAGADVHLKWNRAVAPDLRDYALYRATTSGVTPIPINFLANSDDTLAIDPNAPTSALYYIVTALDVHANQSAPSNEASVGALTSIGNTPSITALVVLDNMPNPFTSTTTLRVGLPKASDVEIEVFDVAGRLVRSEHTAALAAGWREISFQARDTAGMKLPSGVYFYRVSAAGQAITRKMVVAR